MKHEEKNMPDNQKQVQEDKKPAVNETGGFHFEGHIKIFDPESGEVFQDKRNAIHYENMSVALVQALSNQGLGTIYEMAFGSGGTSVDPTGLITKYKKSIYVNMKDSPLIQVPVGNENNKDSEITENIQSILKILENQKIFERGVDSFIRSMYVKTTMGEAIKV